LCLLGLHVTVTFLRLSQVLDDAVAARVQLFLGKRAENVRRFDGPSLLATPLQNRLLVVPRVVPRCLGADHAATSSSLLMAPRMKPPDPRLSPKLRGMKPRDTSRLNGHNVLVVRFAVEIPGLRQPHDGAWLLSPFFFAIFHSPVCFQTNYHLQTQE
jgi:hypothetical protein